MNCQGQYRTALLRQHLYDMCSWSGPCAFSVAVLQAEPLRGCTAGRGYMYSCSRGRGDTAGEHGCFESLVC